MTIDWMAEIAARDPLIENLGGQICFWCSHQNDLIPDYPGGRHRDDCVWVRAAHEHALRGDDV